MKQFIYILSIFCWAICNVTPCHAQKDTISYPSFEKRLEVIDLMMDNQLYTKAMTELKGLERYVRTKGSIEDQVNYHLLIARVYRLSGKMEDAMLELDKMPNLHNDKKLKLKVDFRRAALYTENGNYSMDQRIALVYPIIDEGIKNAKSLGANNDLASFYNLKATMHRDECGYAQRNCVENKKIARKFYKKAMNLFLLTKDTMNYHNVLNGLFNLEMDDRTPQVDSLKSIVQAITERSSYAPNIIVSRNLLKNYYLNLKNDTVRSLRESILAQDAMVQLVNNNADNAINKMKLLYEFDTLKSNVKHKNELLLKQDAVIQEKNKSITQTIVFSIALGILLVFLTYFLFRQRKLMKQMNITNSELQKSNDKYEFLVKESNHRIKNNLQMITSMLELDKENLNKGGLEVLTDVSAKLSTITALHRILDFREHNQKVMMKIYFDEIISYYTDLSKNEIVLSTEFANPAIQSERIIYFGLVLNEMLSNTLKHRKENDEVTVQVLKSTDNYVFIYRDNSNFGSFTKNNGILLIEGLIARLGGFNLVINSKVGEYKFYFNE